jgi:hypothetical protein
MAIMHMVQPAVHQPIDMIAMRHGFMAAAGAVDMGAAAGAHAAIGIGGRHGDDMIINMIAMHVMQMAIVQIIDMAIMLHGGVAAAWAMHMGVIGVNVAGHQARSFVTN